MHSYKEEYIATLHIGSLLLPTYRYMQNYRLVALLL